MLAIEHNDLSYKIYERLKEMILTNKLFPGEKILQENLAQQLGVSRTPLLKALQMLEHELLVESIPRRGMFVKKMSMREILDAFDCRDGIESMAAGVAAEKITDEQVQLLKNLFNPFKNNLDNVDMNAYKYADQKFHKMIVKISDNKILTRLEMFNNIMIITYQEGLVRPPYETLPEHFDIIEALEKRDRENARQNMRLHIQKSRELIAKAIKENAN